MISKEKRRGQHEERESFLPLALPSPPPQHDAGFGAFGSRPAGRTLLQPPGSPSPASCIIDLRTRGEAPTAGMMITDQQATKSERATKRERGLHLRTISHNACYSVWPFPLLRFPVLLGETGKISGDFLANGSGHFTLAPWRRVSQLRTPRTRGGNGL